MPEPQEYETIIDPEGLVWTFVGYLTHVGVSAAQVALTLLLLGLAIGAVRQSGRTPAALVAAILALALLLPVTVSATFMVSILACVAGAGWFTFVAPIERVWLRRLGAVACMVVGTFGLWERADPLAQALTIGSKMSLWRAEEVGWQVRTDAAAPKVGDLAPDFELSDPRGEKHVRLSTFRGKRPVVLAFGSYT